MADMHKTTIYIDPERVRQLKQLALNEGKTMSDLIREALDRVYGEKTNEGTTEVRTDRRGGE